MTFVSGIHGLPPGRSAESLRVMIMRYSDEWSSSSSQTDYHDKDFTGWDPANSFVRPS